MKEGDVVVGDSGRRFKIGRLLAIQGKEGCQDPLCTRTGIGPDSQCRGYHCPTCGARTSSQGHDCPEDPR